MIGRSFGPYRIDEALGQGGMGQVYRAFDTRLGRPVAFKVLDPKFTADPERRRRFLQEARAACAVNHPAIAQIYDVGEESDRAWIVLELVDGSTVRDLIARGEIDLLGAIDIGIQIAEGLARAHETGIVHRDIKAENVMVTRDGHAKILDFGLAKLLDSRLDTPAPSEDERSRMETIAETQAGLVLGTIGYMSPEQARGRAVDHRSDLFSLGVLIYEMVSGQRPFTGASPVDTLHAIAFEEIRPLTTIRENVPASVQRVVARCLRKRPEDRYESAREVARDLAGIRREIETGVSTPVPLADRLREEWAALRERTPAELAWPLGIAVGAVALLVFLLWRDESPLSSLVLLAIVTAIAWRRVRNRNRVLLGRFAHRAAKIPQVRAIVQRGTTAVVAIDPAPAAVYVRLHALLEQVNRKMFYGPPYALEIRDDLGDDRVTGVLRSGAALYVRETAPERRS